MDMVGKDVENNCSRGNGSPSVADSILELPIANISRVADNIVRGETLWASRNRLYLDKVKEPVWM